MAVTDMTRLIQPIRPGRQNSPAEFLKHTAGRSGYLEALSRSIRTARSDRSTGFSRAPSNARSQTRDATASRPRPSAAAKHQSPQPDGKHADRPSTQADSAERTAEPERKAGRRSDGEHPASATSNADRDRARPAANDQPKTSINDAPPPDPAPVQDGHSVPGDSTHNDLPAHLVGRPPAHLPELFADDGNGSAPAQGPNVETQVKLNEASQADDPRPPRGLAEMFGGQTGDPVSEAGAPLIQPDGGGEVLRNTPEAQTESQSTATEAPRDTSNNFDSTSAGPSAAGRVAEVEPGAREGGQRSNHAVSALPGVEPTSGQDGASQQSSGEGGSAGNNGTADGGRTSHSVQTGSGGNAVKAPSSSIAGASDGSSLPVDNSSGNSSSPLTGSADNTHSESTGTTPPAPNAPVAQPEAQMRSEFVAETSTPLRSPRSAPGQRAMQPASSTTQNLPGSERGQHQFAQRVADGLRYAAVNNRSFRVHLHPPELGVLQIEITNDGGAMSARLEVHNTAARQALNDNLGQLKQSLVRHGVSLEKIEVHLSQTAADEQTGNRADDRHQHRSFQDGSFQDDSSEEDGSPHHGDDGSRHTHDEDAETTTSTPAEGTSAGIATFADETSANAVAQQTGSSGRGIDVDV